MTMKDSISIIHKVFDVRHLLLDDTQNHDYFIKVDAPLSIFLISPFEKVKPFMQDFPEFQFIGAGPVSMDVFGADINKTLGRNIRTQSSNLGQCHDLR